MTNNNIPTGRFVWFELYTKELDKAQGFYGELFGWKTQAMPMPGGTGSYTMIVADGATIGGYMAPPPGAPQHSHWLSHLQVASAAESAAKVKASGGRIGLEPVKMGDFGTFAVALDPSGAAFALWQPGKPEGDGNFKGKPGTPCWNELFTDAPEKCVAFYQAIGGFTTKAMPMPTGDYHLLEHDGASRAGVTKTPMPGVPNQWLPYFQVASADQTTAKAKKLGAKVHVEPQDIPNVGRFALFADSTGATFGILQPAPR
jgi:predicted enzyme related to lactoylglutathione lyase